MDKDWIRNNRLIIAIQKKSDSGKDLLVWNRGVRAYRRIALMKRDAGGSRKVTNLLKPSQDLG